MWDPKSRAGGTLGLSVGDERDSSEEQRSIRLSDSNGQDFGCGRISFYEIIKILALILAVI